MMQIKYNGGWWGVYGAHPQMVPKFKKFIEAVRWAKMLRGLEVPELNSYGAGQVFPNRPTILSYRGISEDNLWTGEFSLYSGQLELDTYPTLAEAIDAAHILAAEIAAS